MNTRLIPSGVYTTITTITSSAVIGQSSATVHAQPKCGTTETAGRALLLTM
jgi:hypothetical protein